MSRSLKITIEESAESLEKQLKNTRTTNPQERIQVLWWLKIGQVQEHQELAHRLGRDKSTITGVVTKVSTCGLSELLLVKKAPGQVPHLTLSGISRTQRTEAKKEQPSKATEKLLNGSKPSII